MEEEKDAVRFTNRLVEVIKKIPVPIIFSVLSISLLILYWFVGIFLFHREFYKNNSIWITLLFSFAFSFTWFILSTGLSVLSVTYYDAIKKEQTDVNGIVFVGGFLSVIYLCFAILLTYILRKHYPFVNFDYFLSIAYIYMTFRVLWVSGAWLIHWACKKKSNTTQL